MRRVVTELATGAADATSYDVVVVGSGVAGLTAAVTASVEGLRVLVVEKEALLGGTSALSGGTVWIPPREIHGEAGHHPSSAMAYLSALIGDSAPSVLLHRFLECGQDALDYLRARADIRFLVRDHSPDYHPEMPGGSLGGRSHNPMAFDGRRLGKAGFKRLRRPMEAFTLLGGMMVDLQDVQHLLQAWRSPRSCAHGLSLLARYLGDRLKGYGRGTRLVLGNALVAQLLAALDSRTVACLVNVPATDLVVEDGRVIGVEVVRDGKAQVLHATKGVVVASGGFPWGMPLRREYSSEPSTSFSVAAPGSKGEGIEMALRVGASVGAPQKEPAFWVPVSIHRGDDGREFRYPHFAWDRAKPGLIAVNRAGERFVNEASSYHAFVRAMPRPAAPTGSRTAFLICDSKFMRKWGLGLARPAGWPRRHLLRSGYLVKGDTLEGLARSIGVDAGGLVRTVERMNRFASNGHDDDFGKGASAYNRHLGDPLHSPNPCVGELRHAPFFAVQVHPGDIGTTIGVQTDIHARAVNRSGQPIAGLYVVGNDMHSIMAGEYPGPGITLGPAVTFGWIAARHLATAPV